MTTRTPVPYGTGVLSSRDVGRRPRSKERT
ncbi:hypothetical protein CLV28_2340 [Sediminihabitans luteus]|uniref:Uncharacterized protein n=1 Tax=Sediminihabitans luteus TaxID=1138585 RepID=A0A2M9CD56_9CELL|nr:hypothetical protein CLV28_2340 [Sediminihabitans luteus]